MKNNLLLFTTTGLAAHRTHLCALKSVITKINPVFSFLEFWGGERRNGTGGRCKVKSSIQMTHECKLGNLTLVLIPV